MKPTQWRLSLGPSRGQSQNTSFSGSFLHSSQRARWEKDTICNCSIEAGVTNCYIWRFSSFFLGKARTIDIFLMVFKKNHVFVSFEKGLFFSITEIIAKAKSKLWIVRSLPTKIY